MRVNVIRAGGLVFLLCAGLVVAGNLSVSNILPRTIIQANALRIELVSPMEGDTYYLYYRSKGSKTYQVRFMQPGKNGKPGYRIQLDTLYGKDLEYFVLTSQGKKQGKLSPVFSVTDLDTGGTPRVYFMQNGAVTSPQAAKRDPFLRMSGSLSTTTRLHDESDTQSDGFTANGNMRFYRNIYNEKYQFDFDSSFSYMSSVSDTESHVNLSSMKVAYTRGKLKFEAGDLSVSGSDFSTSYLNRRGLTAQMENNWLHVSSFLVNSQQKTGFEGFGIPPSGAMFVGAVLGFQKANLFQVRGTFLTGQDNLDSKTVYSSEDLIREGNVMSLAGNLWLFQSKLTLEGEYAHSSFGKGDTEEDLDKYSGDALKAKASFRVGIFNGSSAYNKIDNTYNSIANLFLQNDREGWTNSLGMNYKSFSANLNYNDMTTNLNNEFQPALRTKMVKGDFKWLLGNHFSIGAEYGLDNLDYDESTGLQSSSQDMDTISYAGTIGFVAGANNVTLRVGKKESRNFTSNLDASLTVSLNFGNFMSFSPTFSYQDSDDMRSGSNTKMYNVYLNSQVTFIQQVLSLTISGSWSKTDSDLSDSENINVTTNLNLYMSKFFKQKIQPTLTLTARYQGSTYSGISNDNLAAYMMLSVSF